MHRTLAVLAAPILVAMIAVAEPASPPQPFAIFMREFVAITPCQGNFSASYQRGSPDGPPAERPAREVKLNYSFAMAKYEATQELYELVMGTNPSRWKGRRNSVEMVSWHDAQEFCRKATALLRERKLISLDDQIRLPTEAEWEYACRAGTKTAYSFGDDPKLLGEFAWYDGNAKGNDPPVGRKKPNPWGLYDVHGYVWEWCQDAWHPSYDGAPTDGSAREAPDAKERVVRGGSWADGADRARSAYRHHLPADNRSDAVGFRCVKAKEKR